MSPTPIDPVVITRAVMPPCPPQSVLREPNAGERHGARDRTCGFARRAANDDDFDPPLDLGRFVEIADGLQWGTLLLQSEWLRRRGRVGLPLISWAGYFGGNAPT
jgi:hypothetical protein